MYIQLGLESFNFQTGTKDSQKIKREFGNLKTKILNEQFLLTFCRVTDYIIKREKFRFFNILKNDQFSYLEQEATRNLVQKRIIQFRKFYERFQVNPKERTTTLRKYFYRWSVKVNFYFVKVCLENLLIRGRIKEETVGWRFLYMISQQQKQNKLQYLQFVENLDKILSHKQEKQIYQQKNYFIYALLFNNYIKNQQELNTTRISFAALLEKKIEDKAQMMIQSVQNKNFKQKIVRLLEEKNKKKVQFCYKRIFFVNRRECINAYFEFNQLLINKLSKKVLLMQKCKNPGIFLHEKMKKRQKKYYSFYFGLLKKKTIHSEKFKLVLYQFEHSMKAYLQRVFKQKGFFALKYKNQKIDSLISSVENLQKLYRKFDDSRKYSFFKQYKNYRHIQKTTLILRIMYNYYSELKSKKQFIFKILSEFRVDQSLVLQRFQIGLIQRYNEKKLYALSQLKNNWHFNKQTEKNHQYLKFCNKIFAKLRNSCQKKLEISFKKFDFVLQRQKVIVKREMLYFTENQKAKKRQVLRIMKQNKQFQIQKTSAYTKIFTILSQLQKVHDNEYCFQFLTKLKHNHQLYNKKKNNLNFIVQRLNNAKKIVIFKLVYNNKKTKLQNNKLELVKIKLQYGLNYLQIIKKSQKNRIFYQLLRHNRRYNDQLKKAMQKILVVFAKKRFENKTGCLYDLKQKTKVQIQKQKYIALFKFSNIVNKKKNQNKNFLIKCLNTIKQNQRNLQNLFKKSIYRNIQSKYTAYQEVKSFCLKMENNDLQEKIAQNNKSITQNENYQQNLTNTIQETLFTRLNLKIKQNTQKHTMYKLLEFIRNEKQKLKSLQILEAKIHLNFTSYGFQQIDKECVQRKNIQQKYQSFLSKITQYINKFTKKQLQQAIQNIKSKSIFQKVQFEKLLLVFEKQRTKQKSFLNIALTYSQQQIYKEKLLKKKNSSIIMIFRIIQNLEAQKKQTFKLFLGKFQNKRKIQSLLTTVEKKIDRQKLNYLNFLKYNNISLNLREKRVQRQQTATQQIVLKLENSYLQIKQKSAYKIIVCYEKQKILEKMFFRYFSNYKQKNFIDLNTLFKTLYKRNVLKLCLQNISNLKINNNKRQLRLSFLLMRQRRNFKNVFVDFAMVNCQINKQYAISDIKVFALKFKQTYNYKLNIQKRTLQKLENANYKKLQTILVYLKNLQLSFEQKRSILFIKWQVKKNLQKYFFELLQNKNNITQNHQIIFEKIKKHIYDKIKQEQRQILHSFQILLDKNKGQAVKNIIKFQYITIKAFLQKLKLHKEIAKKQIRSCVQINLLAKKKLKKNLFLLKIYKLVTKQPKIGQLQQFKNDYGPYGIFYFLQYLFHKKNTQNFRIFLVNCYYNNSKDVKSEDNLNQQKNSSDLQKLKQFQNISFQSIFGKCDDLKNVDQYYSGLKLSKIISRKMKEKDENLKQQLFYYLIGKKTLKIKFLNKRQQKKREAQFIFNLRQLIKSQLEKQNEQMSQHLCKLEDRYEKNKFRKKRVTFNLEMNTEKKINTENQVYKHQNDLKDMKEKKLKAQIDLTKTNNDIEQLKHKKQSILNQIESLLKKKEQHKNDKENMYFLIQENQDWQNEILNEIQNEKNFIFKQTNIMEQIEEKKKENLNNIEKLELQKQQLNEKNIQINKDKGLISKQIQATKQILLQKNNKKDILDKQQDNLKEQKEKNLAQKETLLFQIKNIQDKILFKEKELITFQENIDSCNQEKDSLTNNKVQIENELLKINDAKVQIFQNIQAQQLQQQNFKNSINHLQDKISIKKFQINELKAINKQEKLEDYDEKLNDLQFELQDLEFDLKNDNQQLEECDDQQKLLQNEIILKENQIEMKQQQLKLLQDQIQQSTQLAQKYTQTKNQTKDQIIKEQKQLENMKKEVDSLEENQVNITLKTQEITLKQEENQSEIEKNQKTLKNLKNQKKTLEQTSNLNIRLIKDQQIDIETIEKKQILLEENYKTSQNIKQQKEKILKNLEKELQELQVEQKRLQKKQIQFDENQEENKQIIYENLKKLEEQKVQITKDLSEKTENQKYLDNRIRHYEYDFNQKQSFLDNLQKELKTLTHQKQKYENKLNMYQKNLFKQDQEIDDIKKNLKQIQLQKDLNAKEMLENQQDIEMMNKKIITQQKNEELVKIIIKITDQKKSYYSQLLMRFIASIEDNKDKEIIVRVYKIQNKALMHFRNVINKICLKHLQKFRLNYTDKLCNMYIQSLFNWKLHQIHSQEKQITRLKTAQVYGFEFMARFFEKSNIKSIKKSLYKMQFVNHDKKYQLQKINFLFIKSHYKYKKILATKFKIWHQMRGENIWCSKIIRNIICRTVIDKQLAFWRMIIFKPPPQKIIIYKKGLKMLLETVDAIQAENLFFAFLKLERNILQMNFSTHELHLPEIQTQKDNLSHQKTLESHRDSALFSQADYMDQFEISVIGESTRKLPFVSQISQRFTKQQSIFGRPRQKSVEDISWIYKIQNFEYLTNLFIQKKMRNQFHYFRHQIYKSEDNNNDIDDESMESRYIDIIYENQNFRSKFNEQEIVLKQKEDHKIQQKQRIQELNNLEFKLNLRILDDIIKEQNQKYLLQFLYKIRG